MSTPDTSLNRSSSSPGDLKLIIKAANQKYEDFVIDNFELDWTIKQLKQYLFENYPQKPEISTVRLIYSGKMLHDHWTLSECIRHNSQVKSYIIHLVHSGATRKEEVTSSPNVTTAQTDVDNELTPDTSSMSTSSSSSSSSSSSLASTPLAANTNFVDQSFSRIQRDLNNLYQEQIQEQQSLLTPKQQYEQMLSKYVRYYESNGVSVQENAWYSSYIQQLALYNQMYSNYIQSQNAQFNIRGSNLAAGTSNQSFTEFQSPDNNSISTPASAQQSNQMNNPDNQDQAQQQQPDQEPQPPRPAPVPQAQPDGDREDDWLSLLHNAVSFIVLFSIIYYYSSLERFLVIFSIVIILILYHNGWLTLQRRQVAPRQDARPAQPDNSDEPQAADNNTSEQERQQQESNIPNSFRLFVSFVLTFFTSLIPERPRIAAN